MNKKHENYCKKSSAAKIFEHQFKTKPSEKLSLKLTYLEYLKERFAKELFKPNQSDKLKRDSSFDAVLKASLDSFNTLPKLNVVKEIYKIRPKNFADLLSFEETRKTLKLYEVNSVRKSKNDVPPKPESDAANTRRDGESYMVDDFTLAEPRLEEMVPRRQGDDYIVDDFVLVEPRLDEIQQAADYMVDDFVLVEPRLEEIKPHGQGGDYMVDDFVLIEPKVNEIEPHREGEDYVIGDFVLIKPDKRKPQPHQKGALRKPKHHPETYAESNVRDSVIDFTSGALAGIVQIYVSQPFDTVKVKQQTFPKLYKSMFQCFRQTYQADGIMRGLYAGTLPAVFASVAENSVLFTAYGACQKFVAFVANVDTVDELTCLGHAWAGFFAGFFSAITLCPTEMVKCKLQAISEVKHYVAKDRTAKPINTFQLTRDIFVNEGISGFYRGLLPTFVREMPGFFFFFGGYEATRDYFVEPDQSKEDISALQTMCAGAVGGVALWTTTFPADVIKSRMQINNLKGSMFSVGSEILRKEGILAFYSGLMPTILRTIPATATLFLVYEYCKKMLAEKLP